MQTFAIDVLANCCAILDIMVCLHPGSLAMFLNEIQEGVYLSILNFLQRTSAA